MRSINFKNSALLSSGRRILAVALIAVPVLGLLFTEQALGQTWPAKPIKLIVGFPPGGGIDNCCAKFAAGLARSIGAVRDH